MKDKIVVITGGSRGLGKAIAESLALQGAKVIICSKDKTGLEMTAQSIGATPFVADVTEREDLKKLAAFAVDIFGRIDIWINNAGIWLPHCSVEEIDTEKLHQVFEVNVFGTIYGSQAALAHMRTQGAGTIVNIISTSGLTGRSHSAGYAASKWAVRGFTDSLREECKGSPIRIVSVYPGGMQTTFFDENRPEEVKDFMNPEEVAAKIVGNLGLPNPEEEQIIKRPS